MRLLAAAALALAVPLAASGCEGNLTIGDPSGAPSGGTSGQDDGDAASPLDNPDGTKPGLAAITSGGDRAEAQAHREGRHQGARPEDRLRPRRVRLRVDGQRTRRPLARNGCDTRNDLLKRDGEDVRYRSGSDCVIISLTLHDPYSGKTIEWKKAKATAVQIDHVIPLSYGWQMGAARWSKDKRESSPTTR